MPCSRCTTVPTADLGRKIIYLQSPTEVLNGKIHEILKRMGHAYEEQRGLFVVGPVDFHSFFDAIHRERLFNRLEAEDMRVLPLGPGEEMTTSHLMSVQSLDYWVKLVRGGDLLSVLRRGALRTHFHPIIDVTTGEIFAHEALSRGMDELGRLLSPASLFPPAKDLGLLFNLDRQCREQAIRSASAHRIQGKLFINFTPTAIYDPGHCLETTHAALKASKLESSDVVFEVVETEFVEDYPHLRRILDHYKSQGYGVALDDVGSGNASITTFFDLEPDYMKIDMRLVRGIAENDRHRYLVATLIQMAKRHHVKLVAEGVESAEDARYLSDAGVDYLQGYYFAEPKEKPLLKLPHELFF